MSAFVIKDPACDAVLDASHLGDIEGRSVPSIGVARDGVTTGGRALITSLAIVGPGLIVMIGDNDAGAFSTCSQAGHDYGTALLLLLVPVLYVNQETIVRLAR
jgi:hypothetical protein